MQDYKTKCHKCDKEIPIGVPYFAISKSIEKEMGGFSIQVQTADSILILCEECAPEYEDKEIRKKISELFLVAV
jgi:hypothetical protein